MDHSPMIEDAFFGVEYVGPQEDASDEKEVVVPDLQLHDSDNEVNDGGFEFDRNAPERIVVGYNSNPDVEVAQLGLDVDKYYYPSSKELNTYYSSAEENNNIYHSFDPEKELFDPQFEVGKTFNDMSKFRKAMRNYGVVTMRNLKMKPNKENMAQVVCKKDCKWRIGLKLCPRIYLSENATLSNTVPVIDHRSMDLNDMIEDLEQMQQQEDARKRENAKQRRMARSSQPFVPPKIVNCYATQ